MCFSALETADPMPPPRAMPPPFKRRERKHKECYMCNVCDKCYTSRERLTRHIARHFAGLSSTTTSAQLAAARMHLPTPTSDQLQAAGLSVSVSQPQGFMLNSNTTARPGLACHTTSPRLNSNTTTTTPADAPRQSTPVPSPPTKKGKSVYFLLCYFSF